MKALVIIDVQHGLFATDPAPANASEVIDRINGLAVRARAGGVPVIHVQHEASTGDHFSHGSEAWALDARLHALDSDIFVRKTTPDSFLRTNLQAVLEDNAVSDLVVCGYASEFCVDTSVRRAAALGYGVTLVSDAHTTHDKGHAEASAIVAHHNATLPSIRSFGVKIAAVDAEAVVF